MWIIFFLTITIKTDFSIISYAIVIVDVALYMVSASKIAIKDFIYFVNLYTTNITQRTLPGGHKNQTQLQNFMTICLCRRCNNRKNWFFEWSGKIATNFFGVQQKSCSGSPATTFDVH